MFRLVSSYASSLAGELQAKRQELAGELQAK